MGFALREQERPVPHHPVPHAPRVAPAVQRGGFFRSRSRSSRRTNHMQTKYTRTVKAANTAACSRSLSMDTVILGSRYRAAYI